MARHKERPGGRLRRERLEALLAEEPGLCFAEVAPRLGVTAESVKYHVRILQRRGRVVVRPVRHGRFRKALYLNGQVPREAPAEEAPAEERKAEASK